MVVILKRYTAYAQRWEKTAKGIRKFPQTPISANWSKITPLLAKSKTLLRLYESISGAYFFVVGNHSVWEITCPPAETFNRSRK